MTEMDIKSDLPSVSRSFFKYLHVLEPPDAQVESNQLRVESDQNSVQSATSSSIHSHNSSSAIVYDQPFSSSFSNLIGTYL